MDRAETFATTARMAKDLIVDKTSAVKVNNTYKNRRLRSTRLTSTAYTSGMLDLHFSGGNATSELVNGYIVGSRSETAPVMT